MPMCINEAHHAVSVNVFMDRLGFVQAVLVVCTEHFDRLGLNEDKAALQ
jgi:hypothetical protein